MSITAVNIGLESISYSIKPSLKGDWEKGILEPGEYLDIVDSIAIFADLAGEEDSVLGTAVVGMLNMSLANKKSPNEGNVSNLVYVAY